MYIQIPIYPLSLWERARVRVKYNPDTPAKGIPHTSTVIPAKAGIQVWGGAVP
jgi:hypothetical protein